ncbi:hypothetical protein KP509_16G008000 [Ceratopteris richardii]|uniref:Reticulon-like protein n=1 Tax=Ceratopteris richardii TaxID=49495 RepID=A0A8T2T024_CERRI|nr:hypothetical protein KP509_16G008000 [Ceratopteris richardii]KAH7387146.1 hypothetical protein KP509_16G008000 [Ceratopteris richardii]
MNSSDTDNEPSAAPEIIENIVESLKYSATPGESHVRNSGGYFYDPNLRSRRHERVHELLGSGHSADVLLWRSTHLSAGFLGGATVIWFLFQWIGYHLVSVLSLLLLGFGVTLFVWSNAAAFLSRTPPPIRTLQLPYAQVHSIIEDFRQYANISLSKFHQIIVGKDIIRFLKLVGLLGILMLLGSWFDFLTLIYLAILVGHTVPMFYVKHGETIDQLGDSISKEMNTQLKRFDSSVLSRIPHRQADYLRKAH